MKIQLWWIGKTQVPYIDKGIQDYAQRIQRFENFSTYTLSPKRHTNPDNQRQAEGDAVLSKLASSDYVVLLDERGSQISSQDFAAFVDQKKMQRIKNLVFLIGGAFGFSRSVYVRADKRIALSSMTFPHDLVRLLFLEQLYRAITITRNHPYHHN
ncbi:MAG: 23S rRNA (pseudouridine(1915)-N(3))-methyltransferase RlmH [Saprospiraceae bacterium]|nr:23S rRNA (pseudouridine(1915)-N(3))-methyltransferase RlmH [Saprospiraceae bacterium]